MRARAVRILVVLAATVCVLVAPGVAHADNPQLQATLNVFNLASLPASADAVSAGTVFAATRQDIGYLSNLGLLDATGGIVHFAPSSGAGPADATGDIPAGLALHNDYSGAGTENVFFDADRSLAAGGAPAGLSHQTLTLHVTPGDPPLGTILTSLLVDVFGSVGSLTASNYTLDSGPSGAEAVVTEGRFHIDWPAVPHAAYTLVIGFDVTNPSAGTYAYKPEVSIQAATLLPSGSTAGATSVSQTDPQTGTMTYSVNEVSDWTQPQSNSIGVTMSGVADPPPSAGYSLAVTPTDLTAAAGGTATTNVTVNGDPGFAGIVNVFLNGDGGGPTPPGIYQNGGWPSIAAGGNADIGIAVDPGTAPGDYPLQIVSNDGAGHGAVASIVLHVTPGLPHADFADYRSTYVQAGPSETISSAPQSLGRSWGSRIYNNSVAATVTGAQVSLDTTGVAFTPSLAGGATTGSGVDIAPNSSLWLNDLSASTAPNAVGSIGFDASRSLSPTSIPAGGAVQTVTIRLTPQDARWHDGSFDIQVSATNYGDFPGASIVPGSLSCPTAVGSESTSSYSNSDYADCQLGGSVLGHEYTMSLQIQVPNGTGMSTTYKPGTTIGGHDSVSSANGVQATSVAINDPVLGGTLTATTSSPTVWSYGIYDSGYAFFDQITPVTWSVDLNPTTLTIPAGGSGTTQVTIHEPSSLSAPVSLSLATSPSNSSPPPNFTTGCCWPFIGHDGDVVNLPIVPSGTLAPGTYTIYVIGTVVGQVGNFTEPITIVVTPPIGQAMFSDIRNRQVVLPDTADSLAAGDVNTGTKWWSFELDNMSSIPISNASISVGGSTLPWSPAVTFPTSVTTPTLAGYDFLMLNTLGRYSTGASSVPGQSISTGFDVSRTVSPQVIPVGGATQTVSITITARDPQLAGQSLSISTWTDSFFGGTQIDPLSVTMPTLTHGETSYPYTSDTSIFESLSGVQLNTPYTLSYQVWVPNTTPGTINFAPGVDAGSFSSAAMASSIGTSRAIPDPELGGSMTMSSTDTVQWRPWVNNVTDAILAGRATNSILLDHFLVQLTTPPINAGAPTVVRVTALDSANHRVMSYPGSVDLYDADGNLLTASLTWSGGIGTGTVTFADPHLNQTVQAFDSSGINFAASGISAKFQVYGPLDHLRVSATPATGQTSAPVTIKVTALDSVGHTIPYAGAGLTLTDTQSAPGLTLPSTLSWSAGVGTGNATASSGIHSDSIVATAGAATGTSGLFSRSGAPARITVAVTPTTVQVAGTATVKVTAYDSVGNLVSGYSGTPTFTDLAGVAIFGASTGTGTVSTPITFTGPAKADKVTAFDGALTSPASGAFNVIGPATRLAISVLPANVSVAGTATVKVTAYDGAGNVATGYTGTPTLTDLAGVASFASVAAVNGVSTSSASFTAPAKADKATAVDGALTSPASGAFNVIGDAARLTAAVTPTNISSAATALVKITAYDAAGNVATGYAGTPTITDSAVVGVFVVPAAVNGVIAAATMNFTGPAKADRVTPHDGALTTAASNAFNVIGPAVSFKVVETPTTVARTALATVTTTALDAAGNIATGYAGTVTYSDNLALPAVAPGPYDQVNTNGVIVAHISFTRGPVTSLKIVVTDTASPALTGLSTAFRIT